jgi:cytochrome c-type biogenesis protein CcmH/NrfF
MSNDQLCAQSSTYWAIAVVLCVLIVAVTWYVNQRGVRAHEKQQRILEEKQRERQHTEKMRQVIGK